MAKITFLGSEPIAKGVVPYQMIAQYGEELTAVKVVQKELCDGFMHVFNPNEVHDIKCSCPGMEHIRQFMSNSQFKVDLTALERIRLRVVLSKEEHKVVAATE